MRNAIEREARAMISEGLLNREACQAVEDLIHTIEALPKARPWPGRARSALLKMQRDAWTELESALWRQRRDPQPDFAARMDRWDGELLNLAEAKRRPWRADVADFTAWWAQLPPAAQIYLSIGVGITAWRLPYFLSYRGLDTGDVIGLIVSAPFWVALWPFVVLDALVN